MARKLFESDQAVDELLDRYSKEAGVKIGKAINQAVYNEFLPRESQTLMVEGNYILQEHMAGRLDEFTLKQSLSRGISWLKNFPIEDSQILRTILTHYNNTPFQEPEEDNRNDYVKQLFDDAEARLKEVDPGYVNYHTSIISLGEDICMHWKDVWQDKVMYEVISYLVYTCDMKRPYDWYTCISYLKQIEIAAMFRYSLTEIEKSK